MLTNLARGPARKVWLLGVLLLLFVLPLLSGTYWMYVQSRREIERGELQNDLIHARILSAMVEKDFTSAESVLTSIADRPQVQKDWERGDFASVSRNLEQARKLDPALLFVSIYDTRGTLKIITPQDKIVGWNFAYRDWYRGVTEHWEPYVSEVYRTAADSNPLVVAVAVPIRNAQGRPTGIVMATYSLRQLTDKFRAVESGSSAGFYVLDQHGVIAASPTIDRHSDPVQMFLYGVTESALAGSEGYTRTRVDGRDVFIGFAPIPHLGWAAIYERSASLALAPAVRLHNQFRSMTAYLLLIYLATAAFAGLLMRRQSRLLTANETLNSSLEGKIVELRRTREELDSYFNMSIDLLCIAGEDGYFKRINPAWEKVLGWSTVELTSRPYLDFVHPEDRDATLRESRAQEKGSPAIAFENRYLCENGSYRWLMWNATPLVNGQIHAMARDVTEEKETRGALVRAKEEAERSVRFKDQFLSTMSHELRTPLNAVLGFSDLLAEARYGQLNERQQRYVKHISNGGKHLLRLINDILDLSKIEAGRLQLALTNVCLANAFAEAVDTLRPLIDQKSHVLVQRVDPELSVRADETRLRQILMNLIGNAIKFTADGGKIELTAKQTSGTARVEIRDSGPGIPLEEQKRIFDAFYRLSQGQKAPEGTGLGLAITQRLVELHGGALDVDSKLGAGSCFHFTLPIVPTFEVEKPQTAPGSVHMPAGARILVVEDDSIAAQLLETQLASAGYAVTVCRQPERALLIAAELLPSAITMDIVMKPLNGWELLSSLKSDPRTARIPVIVVTIVDQPSTGALLGADEYIVKPVDKATLLAAVQQCVHRAGFKDGQSILVVDDDAPTREFIAELLSSAGYTVSTAADGPQARRQVAAALPELVILDLILPGVSGFQLLTDWRRDPRTMNLPVFVLTSKDLTPQEKQYLHANAEAFFQKQESWQDELLSRLERVVASGYQVCP